MGGASRRYAGEPFLGSYPVEWTGGPIGQPLLLLNHVPDQAVRGGDLTA